MVQVTPLGRIDSRWPLSPRAPTARSAGSWELRARLSIPSIWATSEGFASTLDRMSEGSPPPEGRLSRIAGIDARGARMIEVWRSSDDAEAFARQSAPRRTTAQLPPPARVAGFEVTSYVVS